jgi:hypothetical protein
VAEGVTAALAATVVHFLERSWTFTSVAGVGLFAAFAAVPLLVRRSRFLGGLALAGALLCAVSFGWRMHARRVLGIQFTPGGDSRWSSAKAHCLVVRYPLRECTKEFEPDYYCYASGPECEESLRRMAMGSVGKDFAYIPCRQYSDGPPQRQVQPL